MTLGWRKLAAWFIVQLVASYLSIKIVLAGAGDIPENLKELMMWNAGFFFAGNVVVHAIKRFDINVKPKPPEG